MVTEEQERGFTLLEVLIAMFIIALVVAQLSAAMEQNHFALGRLEEKTLAHFVGMNKVSELQTAFNWPPLGTRDEVKQMARRDWQITTVVTKAPDPKYRMIEVKVGLKPEGISEELRTLSVLKALMSNHAEQS